MSVPAVCPSHTEWIFLALPILPPPPFFWVEEFISPDLPTPTFTSFVVGDLPFVCIAYACWLKCIFFQTSQNVGAVVIQGFQVKNSRAPGSSVSTCVADLSVWFWDIRIRQYEVQIRIRLRIRIRTPLNQSKIVRKTLIPIVLGLLHDFGKCCKYSF